MGKALKIAKKEITGYFSSPIAFLFLGAFLFINLFIFFWVSSFFSRNIADVRPLFEWMPVLLVFLVGALTMRMWSEERRAGTVEFLMTLPITSFQLVLGKFFACLSLVLIALALTIPLPFTVGLLGDLDWGPVIGAYIASIFLAGSYIAIGLFVSAKNENQIVSLMITVLLCLTLYFLGSSSLLPFVGNQGAELLQLLGSGSRFESITRGVLDVRDLYYYISVIGVFLALNVYALEQLRWSKAGDSPAPTLWRNITGLLCLNFLVANVWLHNFNSIRVDLTENEMYSISDASKNYISQLQEPLLIRGYFSDKTHPLLTPFVPQMRDLIKEYEVIGNGKIRAEFIDPRENPELEEEANQKYEIKPVPFQISGKYDVSLVNSYFDILIKYGDKHEVVNFQDLIEVKVRGETDFDVKLRNPEYDITKNIKKVMYGFQTTDNLFQTLAGPAVFTGFISADNKLPDVLREYKQTLTNTLSELSENAAGKLQIDIKDPEEGDGSLAKEIEEKHGFRPMAANIFSNNRFYFYGLLSTKDKAITVPLPEDFNEAGAKSSIESALKRLSPGFLKTVGIVEPPRQAPPSFNPAMMQQPPNQKTFRAIQERLKESYTVNALDLNKGIVPEAVDLILVAAPKDLTEKGVFALDQFVMKGGTAILLTSPYEITRTETELKHEKSKSGLNDWLRHNGIRILDEMVFDPQHENYPIPVQRNLGAFKVQEIQMVPYLPFADIRSDGMNKDSLITSGIPQVTLNWSSPIEFEKEKNEALKVTTLLQSSDESWSYAPESVLPDFREHPEYGLLSAAPRRSTVGVVVEGSFTSFFTGKDSPLLGEEESEEPPAPPTEDGEIPEEKEVVSGIIEKSPETAKVIVFSSNEFVADQTISISARSGGSQFLNTLQLIHNSIDWSLEDRGLLSIRSRGHFTRTLYPLDKQGQLIWEYGNYFAALFGLLVVFLIYRTKLNSRKSAHAALMKEEETTNPPLKKAA